MNETWTTQPFLGLVPDFHADPALGGVPLASADGHWWWDGTRWTPLHPPAGEDAGTPAGGAPPTAPLTRGTGQPAPAWAEAS